jgi:hypothetical protein
LVHYVAQVRRKRHFALLIRQCGGARERGDHLLFFTRRWSVCVTSMVVSAEYRHARAKDTDRAML